MTVSTPSLPSTAGVALDLAILGNGFFVVRDAETQQSFVTQSGHFRIDENGFLLSGGRTRLQGRIGGDRSTLGDIQMIAAGLALDSIPGSAMLCYTIDDRGRITAHLSDGESYMCGQIMLQNFEDPQALVSERNDLYSNLTAAGPLPDLAAPGSHGLGALQPTVLELSSAGQK